MTQEDLMNDPKYQKFLVRNRVNQAALVLSVAAMIFGLIWLIWILYETLVLGFGGLSFATLTQDTPNPGEPGGGLANAIFGSFLMVSIATLIGTPIGIMAGIYLAEYNPKGTLSVVTRFVNDILLSAPSIVIAVTLIV